MSSPYKIRRIVDHILTGMTEQSIYEDFEFDFKEIAERVRILHSRRVHVLESYSQLQTKMKSCDGRLSQVRNELMSFAVTLAPCVKLRVA